MASLDDKLGIIKVEQVYREINTGLQDFAGNVLPNL